MKKVMSSFLSMVMLLGVLIFYDPTQAYAVVDLSQRKLTDAQITAMLNNTPQKLRMDISTPADAISFLNKKFPSLWMSYHLRQDANNNIIILRSGQEILSSSVAGRSDMATAMSYLLSDDMDIKSIYGYYHGLDGSLDPILEANYIYTNSEYDIFDPVVGMDSDQGSRGKFILPNMTVSSMDDYAKAISNDSTLSNVVDVDSLYVIKDGQQITFTDKDGWTTITQPTVQPFYSNKSISDKINDCMNPENIDKYKLPKILGELTLSATDAKALIGQPPAVIKENVKTAGDLLLYMLAAKMKLKNGDEQVMADGHQWHYNDTADVTLKENLGNCGRMANLANYLLEGDYQEIGFILQSYTGHSGGHVYNYIKYQDKYYIVDFSSYLFNNYDPSNEFNFISMGNLKDYATRYKECYGGVAEIIAHTSPGTHLPNVWEGDYCYYPDNAKFTIIMQTSECQVSTLPCPLQVPDWQNPQCSEQVSTPTPKLTQTPAPAPTPKAISTPITVTIINNYGNKSDTITLKNTAKWDIAIVYLNSSDEAYPKYIETARTSSLNINVLPKTLNVKGGVVYVKIIRRDKVAYSQKVNYVAEKK